VRIVKALGFDCAVNANMAHVQVGTAIRTQITDRATTRFLEAHREAVVVNLGAGLCTRFSRVDNGLVDWIELDLAPVGVVWRRVLVETARHRFVEHSVLDFGWIETVGRMAAGRPILFIAEGLLMYFDEADVRRLFLALSSAFSGGEILVEAVSPLMARNSRLHPAVAKTKAVFAWGVGSLRDLERWSPRIELIEEWHHLDFHSARWGWLRAVRWLPPIRHLFKLGHLRFR
jgi:O-methyltransferase involved in polyketide biosynthesis